MPNLRPIEILLIVLVVLLLFGARRLPELARSVGKSLKIFKSEVKDLREDDRPATSPELTDTRPSTTTDLRTDLGAGSHPTARPDDRLGTTPPHGDPTFDARTDSADRKQV